MLFEYSRSYAFPYIFFREILWSACEHSKLQENGIYLKKINGNILV